MAASSWPNEQITSENLDNARLDLSDFDIDDTMLAELRDRIDLATSEQVESLNLGGNRISGGQGVDCLCQTVLSADRIRWSLEFLSLEQNELGNDGVEILCSRLGPSRSLLPKLTRLNLHLVGMGPDALSCIAQLIVRPTDNDGQDTTVKFQGLESLQLDHNRLRDIDPQFCQAIADSECTLRFLSMRRTLLSEKSVVALLQAVTNNRTLQRLNLEEVPVTGAAVTALEQALKSENSCLRALLLSQAKFKLSPDAGRSLGAALAVNHTLALLDLTSNGLNDAQIVELARGLAVNQGLRRLDLASNAIKDEGVQALASALLSNSHLQALMLDRNQFTSSGCEALARSLETNCTLQTLTINTNPNIGGQGIQALFTSLCRNRALQLLNVSHTAMSGEQCPALATLLLSNSTLTSLDLSLNPLSDQGIEHISEALAANTTLTSFIACDAETTAAGCQSLLAKLVSNNSTLEKIALTPRSHLEQTFVVRNSRNNTQRNISLLGILQEFA